MLEHAVVFQLKATANDDAKQGIVDGLLSLKESCAQWVKTEAVGKFQSSSCLLFVSMYTLPLLVTVIRTLLSVNFFTCSEANHVGGIYIQHVLEPLYFPNLSLQTPL